MNPERLLQHFDQLAEAPDVLPRLRRFILDLAVRGKLVEQDPTDEPASELLKRFESERIRLTRIGEIRCRKGDSPPEEIGGTFPIPANWSWARFGHLVDFSAGKTPSRNDTSYWNTGDYPWVCIADMTDGGLVASTKETVSEKAKTAIFKRDPPRAGTILMSFKLTIGKVSRLAVPAFHNEAIISIYPHIRELDPYLFRFLPLLSESGLTKGAIKGATLNRDSLSRLQVPLPPLAEQHRIVAKVDELMGLCDELEAAQAKRERRRDRLVAATLHGLNNGDASADPGARPTFQDSARFYFNRLPRLTTRPEHIHQLRQTILNLAVRGKLVKQDPGDEPSSKLFERIEMEREQLVKQEVITLPKRLPPVHPKDVPFQLPETWKWVRLGHLGFEFQNGISKRTGETGLPTIVLRLADVSGGRIDLSEPREILLTDTEREKYGLSSTDILVTRVNGSIELVGALTLVGAHEPHLCYCDHFIRMRALHSLLSSTYVELVGRSKLCRNAMEQLFITTAGQKTVNQGHIASILISLPPLAEQHRIVAKVDELMALCDELEARLTTTATTRRQLLEATIREVLEGEA